MLVTLKYGLNSLTKNVESGSTINDVVQDPDNQAGLGYGENVDTLVEGTVVEGFTSLAEGDTIELRTKANTKA
jgi:hypothetical protein